ncbi:hypothetical protein SCLCIDRAFT_26887 [Scleroderma citrinum Foug A]|uniref:Uncharacterized protein n=1 Tax=Scleroderma citrinum Foug A TaxID=1036808 RepID=A0A0C3DVD2_9AGAM|nr:hypothetical protein SCLCIDRAFT_26887 [Scleroderma citrinum Foug A]
MQMDDDPFLSEPIMQPLEVPSNGGAQQSTAVQPPSRNTNVSVCGQVKENILSLSTDCPSDLPRQVKGNTDDEASQEAGDNTPWKESVNGNARRALTEESVVERSQTLSRDPSAYPLPKPFRLAAKPGCASSHAPDQLGLQPVDTELTAERSRTLSRDCSPRPPSRPFQVAVKRGLVPSSTLDRLGFEPMDTNNPSTRIVPPTLNSLSRPLSPSPGASWVPPSGTLTIPDSTNISGVAVSEIAD